MIQFTKMNGAGNDFVMIDHREGLLESSLGTLAPRMCHRHFGIGADGLILIENSDTADFKMRIINADGSEAEMCGNGARCAVLFAKSLGIGAATVRFETLAGTLQAVTDEQDLVTIQMSEPFDRQDHMEIEDKGRLFDVSFINTGVPHAIVFVQNLDKADVLGLGRLIRYHEAFAPAGTNVNIVEVTGDDSIAIRTYERGVEGETFACGTGATAAAIMAHIVYGVNAPVQVAVKGGALTIDFKVNDQVINDVSMQGGADFVFQGGYEYV